MFDLLKKLFIKRDYDGEKKDKNDDGTIIVNTGFQKFFTCDALEKNRIVFFNNGLIRPCCRLINPIGYDVKEKSIKHELGGAYFIPLESFTFSKYDDVKHKTFLDFDRGVFGGCDGCSELRRTHMRSEGPLIGQIDFGFFSTCNLKCIYCPLGTWYHHPISDYYDDVFRIITTLIHEKRVDKKAIVTFSGGEPTLLPQLESLCSLFQSYSHSITYNFLTNGVIISDTLINLIINNENININISLDSGNREGYFRIKGKDYFNSVIDHIKCYKELIDQSSNKNSSISLKFIIIEENIDQIPLFIKLCKGLGIYSVSYDVDFHIKRSDQVSDAINLFHEIAREERINCNYVGVGSR